MCVWGGGGGGGGVVMLPGAVSVRLLSFFGMTGSFFDAVVTPGGRGWGGGGGDLNTNYLVHYPCGFCLLL